MKPKPKHDDDQAQDVAPRRRSRRRYSVTLELSLGSFATPVALFESVKQWFAHRGCAPSGGVVFPKHGSLLEVVVDGRTHADYEAGLDLLDVIGPGDRRLVEAMVAAERAARAPRASRRRRAGAPRV